MEQNYCDVIRPISVVAQEAVNYIAGRREHNITSLKTRWKKFNKQCMGGIEPNTVYTIAGISGSGKSSMANLIQTDIIDLNPNEDIIVLTFSLEMVGFRQVGRTLSNKLRRTTSTLYSSETDLDESTFKDVINVSNQLKKYPIYFVDNPSTKQEGSTIETISELERVFIQAKKLPLTSVIQLAQMNRNIEQPERINNPLSHYPMRSDLSSSDSIFQASDYVLVIHRPEILNIQEYGPNHLPVNNKVYLHMLKNRDAGKPCILEFENDLMYNNLIES